MFLSFNPFLGLFEDAFRLLNAACASDDSSMRFALARSSSMHSLAALHSAANAVLHFDEAKNWMTASLVRKFDRLFELHGREALPESELEILQELEVVDSLLNNPRPAMAQTFPDSQSPKRMEFARTALKCFNLESLNWPVEYAACVLALVVRFLNRFFLEHLEFDQARIDVTLGNHVGKDSSYGSYLDGLRLERLKQSHAQLISNQTLMAELQSVRWLIESKFFDVIFLGVHPPAESTDSY
jgi:hypothetical protein